MEYKFIKVEREDRIALVTIDRQDKLNALNGETLVELDRVLTTLALDGEVGVVILTGAGQKAFVAGADIEEIAGLTPRQGREMARKGQALTRKMDGFPKPIIGAINGFALGGGLELSLACHIRLASEKAKLGLPEVTLGLIPGYGGTQRLARLVGRGKAMEMILTGAMIDGEEALRIGLVNQVIPSDELLDRAKKMAKKMLRNGPVALQCALEAVDRGLSAPLDQGLDIEADLFGLCCATEDMKEGTRAFLEKRKANFQGK